MGIKKKLWLVLCLALLSGLSHAQKMSRPPQDSLPPDDISSVAIGIYYPNEKELLVPTFIGAVNQWLRRYEPKLTTREATRAQMRVYYANMYDIVFVVKDGEYEITARLAENVVREERAQKLAGKLSSGIQNAMEEQLRRAAARGQSSRND